MILLFLIGVLLFSCSENSNNEEVNFTGNVLLQTQEEINAFGENQYQRIIGELVIRPGYGTDNIVDLSPLGSINTIDGSLSISGCSGLQNVEMNVVESGILFIKNMNSKNINFPFFKRTTSDFLIISDNKILETINFENLESTGSELRIVNNSRIENLNGFQSLVSLGSNFDSGLQISENPMLINLSGLSNINSDIGLLEINKNGNLTSLNGLENINYGAIIIFLNENLVDFCAISNSVINGNIDGEMFIDGQTYQVVENGINPTVENLINGNCN